jgi:hypothetical protein
LNFRGSFELKLFLFAGVFLLLTTLAQAQDSLFDETPYRELKDVTDFFKKKHHDSVTESHRLQVSVLPAVGYTLLTGFAGAISANAGFYTAHDPSTKISTVFTSYSYSQYHQTIMPLWADIWSKNGKFNYITDWRYMQYPSKTWGLGGRRDPVDGFTINFTYLKLHQMVLFKIRQNLFIGTGFFFDYFWNIREIDAPLNNTTFQRYGLNKDERAAGIPVRILYDSRLNQINPKNGWYVSLTYRNNSRTLYSNQNWESFVGDIRKYIRLPGKSDNILAFWSYTWLTRSSPNNRVPYLLLPSTGWDDFFNTGRGYIQGRYRSQNMVYLESEYRFKLTRNGLLGGVAFANIESFQRNLLQPGRTQYAPGAGVGLRVKLNKNSGTNLCIDYGIGKDGSRGIFVNLGEVF